MGSLVDVMFVNTLLQLLVFTYYVPNISCVRTIIEKWWIIT